MVPAKAPKRAARRGVATCSRNARRDETCFCDEAPKTKTSRAPSRSSVASKQPHTVRYAYHDY